MPFSLKAQDTVAGKTVAQPRFERLLKKKNSVLLDVRTPEEYREGHLPGAILIDVMQPEEFKKRVSVLDKRKRFLVYCRSGKRSNTAKLIMKGLGFKKLVDLQNGYSQWTGATETK
jgi:rhodanese-related sulfurtransferase